MNDYYPLIAQEYARQRRDKLKKLIRNEALRAFVIEKLHFPWSPDQIAGYLKVIDIEGFYVCRETIYDFIYSTEGRSLNLYRCLCQSFKNRRSETVVGQIKDKLTALPRYARRSLTLDRGSEFSVWKDLQKPVELGSYYCDPRSPWQKGTNKTQTAE